MNILHIAGRIGKDAEIRYTQSGDAVSNFNVAVDSRVNGEKVTTWVRCTMWGERAEKLSPYLTKGTAVAISGEARANAYMPRDSDKPVGQLEVRVNQVTLLGGGKDDQAERPQPQQRRTQDGHQEARQAPARRDAPPADDFEDDIPF